MKMDFQEVGSDKGTIKRKLGNSDSRQNALYKRQ